MVVVANSGVGVSVLGDDLCTYLLLLVFVQDQGTHGAVGGRWSVGLAHCHTTM